MLPTFRLAFCHFDKISEKFKGEKVYPGSWFQAMACWLCCFWAIASRTSWPACVAKQSSHLTAAKRQRGTKEGAQRRSALLG